MPDGDAVLLGLVCGQTILTFDNELRVVASVGTQSLVAGTSRGTIDGMLLEQYLIPEVFGQLKSVCRGALEGVNGALELELDQTVYTVRTVPIPARGSTVIAALCFEDITALRRAEAERDALRVQLERSNRELQEFITIAAHDLQEPLRKVQAFGDRLKAHHSRSLGSEGNDQLRRLNGAIGRMQILIHDLLAYSRVATRAQPFETIDLKSCALEALGDVRPALERSGGQIEIGDLGAVQADPTQIRQVFKQLLDNALKFRRDGAPPVVMVRGALVGDCYEFEVEDNGIGFDDKQLERILAPFKRLHSRNTFEGTGIGLAICRKIIERHNGSIAVRSAPDQGSTFAVRLPLVQLTEPISLGERDG